MIVPAAGAGARMGGVRKPFIELGGRTVLDWALTPFLVRDDVVELVIALGGGGAARERLVQADPRIRVVRGGASRFESVANALHRLESEAGVVAVHDGARPFPLPAAIDACIRLAAGGCGAVAGVPAVDTIKEMDGDRIVGTPRREVLWYAQTPQAFPRGVFEEAVAHCRGSGLSPTDDAAMVEELGVSIRMVASSAINLKITTPEDLVVAEAYIAKGLVTSHV